MAIDPRYFEVFYTRVDIGVLSETIAIEVLSERIATGRPHKIRKTRFQAHVVRNMTCTYSVLASF